MRRFTPTVGVSAHQAPDLPGQRTPAGWGLRGPDAAGEQQRGRGRESSHRGGSWNAGAQLTRATVSSNARRVAHTSAGRTASLPPPALPPSALRPHGARSWEGERRGGSRSPDLNPVWKVELVDVSAVRPLRTPHKQNTGETRFGQLKALSVLQISHDTLRKILYLMERP